MGAYCFVFLTPSKLVAVRGPHGFRPLCIGRAGDAFVVASESCVCDIIGAGYIRSIDPGEIVAIDEEGVSSRFLPPKDPKSFCVFEYICFSTAVPTLVFGNAVT